MPRIEIDNKGIRDVWFLGARSFDWTAIAWFEPIVKKRGDSIDYCVRIILNAAGPPGLADPLDRHDLTLDTFLPSENRDLDATTWVADWLESLRQDAMSQPDVLARLHHPKYLRGEFA